MVDHDKILGDIRSISDNLTKNLGQYSSGFRLHNCGEDDFLGT